MSPVTEHVDVWLSPELHEQLKVQAQWNGHSVGDEIVRQLKLPRGGIGRWVDTAPSKSVLAGLTSQKAPAVSHGDPSKFRSGCLCSGGYTGDQLRSQPLPPSVFLGRLAGDDEDDDPIVSLAMARTRPFPAGVLRPTPNADTRPREGSRRIDMINGLGVHPNGTFFSPLGGQTWVLTGQIPGMTRDDARALLMSYGAEVPGSVTDSTFALVAGQGAASRKLTRAKELDVRIIPADEFVAMSKLFQHGEFPA